MKFASFLKGPPDQSRDVFQAWVRSDYRAALMRAAPTLRGCVSRDVRDVLGTPIDAITSPHDMFGTFDVLIESWFSSVEDFRREILPAEERLRSIGAGVASYHVNPRLELDPRISEAGSTGRRPEVTMICALSWNSGMDGARAAELWARHAGVALRAQPAVTKYEQNVVIEAISWTDGFELFDAFADFSAARIAHCRRALALSLEEAQDSQRFAAKGCFSYLDDAEPVGCWPLTARERQGG